MEDDRVRAYLEALPPERRSALETLRALVREVVPGAEETFKYRMPTYELDGMVCAFASQKRYMSLYVEPEIVSGHMEALTRLNVGKSCIRFRHLEDLPLDTIKEMLREVVALRAGG